MSEKAVPCQLMELLYLPPMYMTAATGLRKRQRMRDSSQRPPITAMTTTEIQSASTVKQFYPPRRGKPQRFIYQFTGTGESSNEVNNDNSVTINEYNGLNQLVKVRKEAILSVIPTIGMG